jgi:uncharacterized membrane-anchored protein
MSGNSAIATLARAAACWFLFVTGALDAQQAPAPEAQEQAAEPASEQPSPEEAVWLDMQRVMLHGPQEVPLAAQAKLMLPEGYGFVPKKEAAALMALMGNTISEHIIGIVFPDTNAGWVASLDFAATGYIEDGDARKWDADELLKSLQADAEKGNVVRRKLRVAPVEITKWVAVPSYDFQQHHLVWSAEQRKIGVDEPDPTINYNTYVLGREGYISLNLITSRSQIENEKPAARQLLAAIQFNPSKRYSDFNADTDPVAKFGVSGLIVRSGPPQSLLDKLGTLLSEYGKFFLMGIAALAAILVRVFRRRRQAALSASA